MKRNYMALCAAILIAACGPSNGPAPAPATASTPTGPSAPPAAGPPAPAETKLDEQTVASSSGTKLRYFRDVLDSDQPQTPSFELEAERFSMTADNLYIVEKATAIAYGKDGSQTKFEAGEGQFDENTKTTQLKGNAICTMGTQRVEMQDVIWTNETQTAATQNPVVVSDGETKLQAGSMEYNTDTKVLALHTLSGTVSMKGPQTDAAPATTDTETFEFIDVKKGGLGEFLDGQLQHITGGVEIALRGPDPNAKPMQLSAEKIEFQWNEGERTKPKGIRLEGGVSVDGPQGLITAGRADLDLAANSLVFAGNVQGKSESIESFDAERIVYDMKTGDSEMTNLVARGISLGAPGAEAKSGAADFSRMNIERAGRVVSSGGQVKTMTGGVSITLEPRAAGGTPMKLNAGEAVFSWSGDGGQPTAIAMRGSVRVDGPQGAIHADRGDLDLAKKELVFTGKVNGSLPQLERFDAGKLVYNIESGETLMSNVTAKGLAIAAQKKDDKPVEDADKKKGYSRMDIESAPEVSLTGQNLNWMRGGVSLIMRADDPKEPPLTVTAGELVFGYEKDQTSPQRILLKQNVAMDAPEMSVKSDQADLNIGANLVVFTGNVSGSTPQVSDFIATQLSYNMATRRFTTKGWKAARVSTKTQEEATQP